MTLTDVATQPSAADLINKRIAHNTQGVTALTKEIHRLEDERERAIFTRTALSEVIEADRRVIRALSGDI